MKRTFNLVILLCVLLIVPSISSVEACHKSAIIWVEQWKNRIIEVGEKVIWKMEIYLKNDRDESGWTDVVVTDNLAAELQIDSIWKSDSSDIVDTYTKGKSEKVHLTWYVGTLNFNEDATLVIYVSTDLNPAGKQEYTSPGTYELNSGPTMKYYLDGKKHSQEINQIIINVQPKLS